jgi:hypothetical protein
MLDSDATGFEEVPSILESRDSLAAWTFQSADDGGSNASVAIIDAQLLFHAGFKRTGDDLTLIGSDGSVHVVAATSNRTCWRQCSRRTVRRSKAT